MRQIEWTKKKNWRKKNQNAFIQCDESSREFFVFLFLFLKPQNYQYCDQWLLCELCDAKKNFIFINSFNDCNLLWNICVFISATNNFIYKKKRPPHTIVPYNLIQSNGNYHSASRVHFLILLIFFFILRSSSYWSFGCTALFKLLIYFCFRCLNINRFMQNKIISLHIPMKKKK